MEAETVEISASSFDCISDNIFGYHCFVLTNIVSSVRVSLSEKAKDNNLKESIDFRVKTK